MALAFSPKTFSDIFPLRPTPNCGVLPEAENHRTPAALKSFCSWQPRCRSSCGPSGTNDPARRRRKTEGRYATGRFGQRRGGRSRSSNQSSTASGSCMDASPAPDASRCRSCGRSMRAPRRLPRDRRSGRVSRHLDRCHGRFPAQRAPGRCAGLRAGVVVRVALLRPDVYRAGRRAHRGVRPLCPTLLYRDLAKECFTAVGD